MGPTGLFALAALLTLGASGCAAAPEPAPVRRPGGVVPPALETAAAPALDPEPIADEADPDGEPPGAADAPPGEPTDVEAVEVRVPGDHPALVVRGEGPAPIVYLHGKCGDPTAFLAWARAGRRFGTILSLRGDIRCKGSGRTRWTEDAKKLDARITKAIEAVQAGLGVEIDAERRIVVGYSQGALRAELLATRYPARYPRAVLIAGPRAPRPASLTKTEAVLLVAGDHDARKHLVEAADKLGKAGRAVRYVELPDARHGDYGSDPVSVFTDGLSWLVGPRG